MDFLAGIVRPFSRLYVPFLILKNSLTEEGFIWVMIFNIPKANMLSRLSSIVKFSALFNKVL